MPRGVKRTSRARMKQPTMEQPRGLAKDCLVGTPLAMKNYFAFGGGAVLIDGLETWKTPEMVRSMESRVNGFTT